MSRALPPVNASLIREFRMIAQQFFRSQETVSFWQSRRTQNAEPTTALKCVTCLRSNKQLKPRAAVAISDGQSVCMLHLS